jgi:hypothetical protein
MMIWCDVVDEAQQLDVEEQCTIRLKAKKLSRSLARLRIRLRVRANNAGFVYVFGKTGLYSQCRAALGYWYHFITHHLSDLGGSVR